MNLRPCPWWLSAALALVVALMGPQARADEAPDALIRRVVNEAIESARGGVTDAPHIAALVDATIMPNVDFARMTAAAVGRAWRQATPEQQERLQDEFKALLVRTYAGALAQVKDQTVTVKPLRAAPADGDVVVRTLVKGGGDPIQVDYRLEKASGAWKIVDFNVMGVWLVEAYRGQFAAEIGAHGVDGLIAALASRRSVVATTR